MSTKTQARLMPLIKLVEQCRYDDVVAVARDLQKMLPTHPYVLKALSFGLIGQGNYDAALPVLNLALQQNANDPELHNNLGICLSAVLRWDEAIPSFDRALTLAPNDPEVWKNKGEAFCHMNRWGEAVPFLVKAIELHPGDYDSAINKLAEALVNSGRNEEAFSCYTVLAEGEPDNPVFCGNLLLAGLRICHWDALDEAVARLRRLTKNFELVGIAPLHALAIPGVSATELQRIAEAFVRSEIPAHWLSQPPLVTVQDRSIERTDRLRIGYLSYDMVSNHPVAYVIPQVLELHDRNRVEVFGYSILRQSNIGAAG